ncbi:Gfo/Idh/MocA family oxidoreductase [Agrobacterium rhizogenes]|uniref:Gfo/Idh/MocA family protein n=1 Tax=Rhizobium rhizogenes TaxID=359 RepID=UPI0022B6B09C|nr:Gfo/Idh/MocA family oxidoreductase [Rhizobium rhizogenes]MCZ7450857.1 Gfo/Idh/MocA family oxidoreductase [Rhizobium rhizogenes]
MRRIGVGIIGCGNISDAYLKAAPKFPVLDIVGVADINPVAAETKAATYSVAAMSIDALLSDQRIEIILNLTTPQHHVPVGLQAVAHGNHIHSEKPLATTLADAERLVSAAREKGVRVGCAPDTFLGGSHQTARRIIDGGTIGAVVAGSLDLHPCVRPQPLRPARYAANGELHAFEGAMAQLQARLQEQAWRAIVQSRSTKVRQLKRSFRKHSVTHRKLIYTMIGGYRP